MQVFQIDQKLYEMMKTRSLKMTIHAIYDTSISGYVEGTLVTILAPHKKMLPYSIVLSSTPWKEQGFLIGETITLNERFSLTIRTSNVDLSLQGCEILQIQKKKEEIIEKLHCTPQFKAGMGKALSLFSPIVNEAHFSSMEAIINERVNKILLDLKHELPITAGNIIGYGQGLTPSADDFILGLLSVLEKKGEEKKRELLQKYILKHYEKTTEVSKWMLYYAAKDHSYPYVIKEYYNSEINTKERLDAFLEHGSTSGLDLLSGIYYGVKLLMEE